MNIILFEDKSNFIILSKLKIFIKSILCLEKTPKDNPNSFRFEKSNLAYSFLIFL